MKRAIAISLARLAGYHEDRRRFTRLLVEARVARPKLLAAWADGERARAAGAMLQNLGVIRFRKRSKRMSCSHNGAAKSRRC